MLSKRPNLTRLSAIGLVILFVGCGDNSPATKPESTTTGKRAEQSGTDSAESKVKQSLAKLSEPDRLLAEKQKTCPVSGEQLGSMGVPIKVNIRDQVVFLCCDGCEGKLKANPELYLKKMAK